MTLNLKPPVTIEELRENQADLKELMTYLKTAEMGGDDVEAMIANTQRRIDKNKKLRDAWYPGQTL